MVTMVADRIFIDTNVLVFASLPLSTMYRTAHAALHEIGQRNGEAWISRQILREYLVQITRPGTIPAGSPVTASAQVATMQSLFRVADETPIVTDNLLDLLTTIGAVGKQVHDANIVATMLAYQIPQLLTDNVKDFKRYSRLITIIPLGP